MKRADDIIKTKRFAVILIVLLAVGGAVLTRLSLAAAGQLYVSPASSSVQNGNTVTVSLRINPGGSVDSVDARLSYDTSKLQFVSFDASGSSFPGSVAETGGNGSIHVARFIGGGSAVTSDALITRVTFKALAGSGNTSLSLAGSNAAYQGAYTDPTLTAGTVAFTTPATPSPPPPPPNPPAAKPNPPSAKPNPSPTPKPGTTPPAAPSAAPAPTPAVAKAACSAQLKTVQFTVATLHVTCNPAARAFIKYGVDGKMVSATQPTAAGTEFDINLSGPLIRPGTPISFAVVGMNDANEQTEGAAQTFTTKGYNIKIKALDKNQKPLAKRTFVLHSVTMTAQSDANGVVTFSNVAAGQHSLELREGKRKLSQAITVDDAMQVAPDGTQYAGSQNYSLSFADASTSKGLLVWLLGLLVIVLGGVFVWLLTNRGNGPLPPGIAKLVQKFSGRHKAPGPMHSSAAESVSRVVQPPEVIKPQVQPPPSTDTKDTPPHAG